MSELKVHVWTQSTCLEAKLNGKYMCERKVENQKGLALTESVGIHLTTSGSSASEHSTLIGRIVFLPDRGIF